MAGNVHDERSLLAMVRPLAFTVATTGLLTIADNEGQYPWQLPGLLTVCALLYAGVLSRPVSKLQAIEAIACAGGLLSLVSALLTAAAAPGEALFLGLLAGAAVACVLVAVRATDTHFLG